VDSLNHTVDDSLTVEGWAVRYASEELQTFLRRFVEEDQDVTREYLVETASTYGGNVNTTLVGDSE